jgi:hypothetical protein
MGSPYFTAWKSTGSSYTITVKFLVIATLVIEDNCVAGYGGHTTATVYTDIYAYDSTLGTNVGIWQQGQQHAITESCGSNVESQTITYDETESQTSTGVFNFTSGDSIAITPDYKTQSYVQNDGSSIVDLENGNVGASTDAAYLTYISVS